MTTGTGWEVRLREAGSGLKAWHFATIVHAHMGGIDFRGCSKTHIAAVVGEAIEATNPNRHWRGAVREPELLEKRLKAAPRRSPHNDFWTWFHTGMKA